MPGTYIQSASGGGTGINSQSVAFPSANTAGNLIIVIVGCVATFGFGTPTLSDSNGNTYELIQSVDTGGEIAAECMAFYAKNCAGGANTVTFSDTGETEVQDITVAIAEYAGLSTSAPLISEVQAAQLSTGNYSFSLLNSSGIPWTIQYEAKGLNSVYGALDFWDGVGADVLIEYEFHNEVGELDPGYPNTSSPSSLAFTLRESYTGSAPELQIYDLLAGTSPAAIAVLPPIPPPEFIEWDLGDTVGSARSPFSKQRQIHNWNASILRATLTYAEMYNSVAMPLLVWLMDTLGIANTFQFGDPQNPGPQNPAAVAGAVSGGGQTGYTLLTTSSDLTPGDWIQVGLRLYRVQSVDGGTLGIWPNLRQSPPDGTPLIITNTLGLFRLAKNQRGYSVKPGQIVERITIEIEEAI